MVPERCASARAVFLLTILSALGFWQPRVAYCQDRAVTGCYAHMDRAKLVSHGAGWAIVEQSMDHPVRGQDCSGERLYWTDDDGQTWRDITPPSLPAGSIGTPFFSDFAWNRGPVFFLDSSHGWMISTKAMSSEDEAPFYLLSTVDGGRTWLSVLLDRPMIGPSAGTLPICVFFSDPLHGWIFWRWSMMNSRVNVLTVTSDGGRTWSRLPEPPGPGPVQFLSATDGWLIGGSEGQEGIPIIEDNQLWSTHDGGRNWRPIQIPVPAGSLEYLGFVALHFGPKGEGVVVAQGSVSGYVQRLFSCVTHDYGHSWQFSHFDAYGARPSLVDGHVIWSISHLTTSPENRFRRLLAPPTILANGTEITPTVPDDLSLQGHLGNIDFIGDSNGWATYANGNIGPFVPPAPFELLSTTDGGKTFRTITPSAGRKYPIPPPELFSLNGSIVRFPQRPPMALPPPHSPDGRQIRFASPVGGPMIIRGTGFRRENTVWVGTHPIQVESDNGEELRFLIPAEVPPGDYSVYVENTDGKTNETTVSIRPRQELRISNVQNGEAVHPGQQIILGGSGFLLENEVLFGKQGVPAKLVLSGGEILQVTVPSSIPTGSCEVSVRNASGTSNAVTVRVE